MKDKFAQILYSTDFSYICKDVSFTRVILLLKEIAGLLIDNI